MACGWPVLYSCVSSLGISSSSPGLFTRTSPRFKSKLHQLSPSEQHHRRDQFQGVLQTCVWEHLDISTLQKKFNDLVGEENTEHGSKPWNLNNISKGRWNSVFFAKVWSVGCSLEHPLVWHVYIAIGFVLALMLTFTRSWWLKCLVLFWTLFLTSSYATLNFM